MLKIFCRTLVTTLVLSINLLSFVNGTALTSSVWCSLTLHNSRKCTFKNLCYNFHSKFIFIFREDSILSGLESREDLKHIYATSVIGHTALPLKISIVSDNYILEENSVFFKDVMLLHRFKPDNLMHVIHDDLLPLYATFLELCLGNVTYCSSKYHLFFSDENFDGPYINWYYVFSRKKPIHLNDFNKSLTACFSNLEVGLSLNSVFYQYGFFKPRGVYKMDPGINYLLDGFRSYILNVFNVPSGNTITNKLTFLDRKVNRKILNECFVKTTFKSVMKDKLKTSVIISNIDLMLNSTQEILLTISTSKYLIGMHGAGMFLAIFLPKKSYTFELFPYGIDKERVSPLFTLSQIPRIQFKYFAWHNTNELHTFPHPEYLPGYGGLGSLSKNEQVNIMNLTNIPSYSCCGDAVFLSRMYQDTIVDHSIINTFELAMNSSSNYLYEQRFDKWFFPSFVRNISCIKNINGLFLNWSPPFNMHENFDIEYRINLETVKSNLSFFTKSDHFYSTAEFDSVKIWIQCIFNGIEGLDTYLIC